MGKQRILSGVEDFAPYIFTSAKADEATLATPEAASQFLAAASVSVVSTPVVETKEREIIQSAITGQAPVPLGTVIGGSVGCVVVISLCIGVRVLIVRRRRKRKTQVVYAIS